MGYEIAGGLGVKLARPDADVVVMVGDGSYLMMNSELATSVMLGAKLTIVRARQPRLRLHQPAADGDRRRQLQQSASATRDHEVLPEIDFAAHAAAHGRARAKGRLDRRARSGAGASRRRRTAPTVIVIDTDPLITTEAGGHWWDVAVPEVSLRGRGQRPRARPTKPRSKRAGRR